MFLDLFITQDSKNAGIGERSGISNHPTWTENTGIHNTSCLVACQQERTNFFKGCSAWHRCHRNKGGFPLGKSKWKFSFGIACAVDHINRFIWFLKLQTKQALYENFIRNGTLQNFYEIIWTKETLIIYIVVIFIAVRCSKLNIHFNWYFCANFLVVIMLSAMKTLSYAHMYRVLCQFSLLTKWRFNLYIAFFAYSTRINKLVVVMVCLISTKRPICCQWACVSMDRRISHDFRKTPILWKFYNKSLDSDH